jgi:hypothetical protein
MYSNVYYEPEDFGLEIVLVVEATPCYDFNMFVVWRDADGHFYAATDSGCSCPSPFEDLTLAELKRQEYGVDELHTLLSDWVGENPYALIDPGEVADGHLKISQLSPLTLAA